MIQKINPNDSFSNHALLGQTLIVTGASSGIGQKVAIQLAHHGGKIALVGRNVERLNETLRLLPGEGHQAFPFDLSQCDEIPAFFKQMASSMGKFNGFFHGAGVESIRPIQLINSKSIDEIFGVSVKAGLMLAKAFIHKNVQDESQPSSLVYVSSAAGSRGQAAMSVYSASKGAIDAMVRSLAVELASKNIRVNALIAGGVETEMHTRLLENLPESAIESYRQHHLLGFGQSLNVADAALFLFSRASAWITGSGLAVDGGYLVK